jgi:glycine cleavage system protein P-like pyridoxal-binding family
MILYSVLMQNTNNVSHVHLVSSGSWHSNVHLTLCKPLCVCVGGGGVSFKCLNISRVLMAYICVTITKTRVQYGPIRILIFT